MKTTLLALLTAVTFSVNAQFPAPADFQFSYEYITCNESGFCAGEMINGPAYCSDFWWNAPDSSGTTAHLEYYKVYYLDYSSWDTAVIATAQELQVEMLIGIIGQIWATAVYSNPDGESPASNTVENIDLPIGISERIINSNELLYYDPVNQSIHFRNPEQIAEVHIVDIQGLTKIRITNTPAVSSIETLNPGCYFVRILKDDGEYVVRKIVR